MIRGLMAQENQRTPSQVVPVLVAALICDTAAQDPSTRKKSLIGIFDRLFVAKYPVQRPMAFYVKVTDAVGWYRISMKFVQTDSGQTLAEINAEVEFADRLGSQDFIVQPPPLPIPAPGRYEFQVWFNDVFLGAAFLDAVPRPS
jgi:hypothetical protein